MTNPVVGHLDCPHCGHEATVHRESRGKRSLYYRCYQGNYKGREVCGTVQIREPGGQAWILDHMRPLDTDNQDDVVKGAGVEAEIQTAEQVREVRRAVKRERGFLEKARDFLADD